MSVIATYLICSTGIRFNDGNGVQLKWLPVIPKVHGRMKPSDVTIRAEAVFKQVPVRIRNLVIVNSNLSSFEILQAAVKVAEKYADKIMVIPPLLARLSFGLEQLANPIMERIPSDEVILVVTIVEEFSDFVIVRRDENFELYVDSHDIYKREECDEMFGKIYDDFYPHSTVFLVHQDFHALAKTVRNKYRPERSFLKVFKRWDFMLFFGGLYRAIDNGEEYDLRYHIPNFSSGYEASIIQRNGPNGRHLLLPERTRVPCDMQSFDGISQNLKINYCAEYLQVFENLNWESRFAAEQFVKTFGSSKQSIGYVDERGVPYVTPRNIIKFAKEGPTKNTNILAFEREKETPYAVPSNNHTVEPTEETNYTPALEFAIEFLSANICEHNTSTKTKLIYENVFDPMNLSSSIKQLSDVLQKKPISTLHVITDENIPNEYNDLFHTRCSSVTYIPHIKAKLSYCFKKIKSEENIEKFAIILVDSNEIMDFLLFEFQRGQYYFIQRVQDLNSEDVENKIKSEYVKDAFIFLPKGVQHSIKKKNEDVTLSVFEVRDYQNMALNGIFDMDENLADLANTKDLKALFMISESHGITTRSASDAGIFSLASSPVSDVLPKNAILPPQIKFLFRGNLYAVEIISNGHTEVMSDWTPLYLSMANGTPEIGEKAKEDFKKFPTYVVYDILKIIGKPLNTIKIDPKWGFKLEENDGNILFQIETPNGPRLIPQEIVLSAFLKAMKIRAESAVDTQIKEIRLSINSKLNESQKAVFEKAAAKNSVEILSFVYD